jgi:hypothetical protein
MQTTSVIEKNFDVNYSISDCHNAMELIIPKFTYLSDNKLAKTTNAYRIRKASGTAAAAFDVTFKIVEEGKTNIYINCIAENRILNLKRQIIEDFTTNFVLGLEGKLDELNKRAKSDSIGFLIGAVVLVVVILLALIFI